MNSFVEDMEDKAIIVSTSEGALISFDEQKAKEYVYELILQGITPKVIFRDKIEVAAFLSKDTGATAILDFDPDIPPEKVSEQTNKRKHVKRNIESSRNQKKISVKAFIFEYLKKYPNKTFTSTEIAKNTGMADQTAWNLTLLCRDGVIMRSEDRPYKYGIKSSENKDASAFINCGARQGKRILKKDCNPNDNHDSCLNCEHYD